MIKTETSIMMIVDHPTIIKLIGYSEVDFHNENNLAIIMEHAQKGSLRDVIKKIQISDGPKDYTNTSRQIILIGVARAMKYLHDHNIIHRDLKADNILLDKDFHPLITDFSLSKIIKDGQYYCQSIFGGTLAYEAPEIIREEKYDKSVDVYAFGILMFEILSDRFPYPELENNGISDYAFKDQVLNNNYRPSFKNTTDIKDSFKNLIEKCWSNDPKERPTFDEIFNKLSNKSNQEEDFLLDDVDINEVNLYIEDITPENEDAIAENKRLKKEITDLKSECKHLHDKINDFEKDNQNLKNEIEKIKQDLDQTRQELSQTKQELSQTRQELCQREMRERQSREEQRREEQNRTEMREQPRREEQCTHLITSHDKRLSNLPNNVSLLSYSVYFQHSVLVTSDGLLMGFGDNSDGQISDTLPRTFIDHFTNFSIKDDHNRRLVAVSAVCYVCGTLYMFSKSNDIGRQLVLCDKYINRGKPVFLNIGKHNPVALFGGYSHIAAIGSEGEVIFINRNSIINSPNSKIKPFYLPRGNKASSVVCCEKYILVLSTKGEVFHSLIEPNGILESTRVSELYNQVITCISGTFEHSLAVSEKGRVFGRGSNECGELNLNQESDSKFTEISSLCNYKIKAVYAGYNHSLFETQKGKILSCGNNYYGQLLLSNKSCEKSLRETKIADASLCIAGYNTSAVFIGSSPPNMPNKRIQ